MVYPLQVTLPYYFWKCFEYLIIVVNSKVVFLQGPSYITLSYNMDPNNSFILTNYLKFLRLPVMSVSHLMSKNTILYFILSKSDYLPDTIESFLITVFSGGSLVKMSLIENFCGFMVDNNPWIIFLARNQSSIYFSLSFSSQ